MSTYLFVGGENLSSFRIERLLQQLRPQAPQLSAVRVLDFFRVGGEQADSAALARLLDAQARPFPAADCVAYVVPRLGTMSPWSSKATDIAKVCGLAGVERIERGRAYFFSGVNSLPQTLWAELHDAMTESVMQYADDLSGVFAHQPARQLRTVEVLAGGKAALEAANRDWGLALSAQEIDYLVAHFGEAGRNPTDAELMMFAQINSEHCRHKIFNGDFTIDGEAQARTLFEMIKVTYAATPEGVLSAYKDNAAVIAGNVAARMFADSEHRYALHTEPVHILMKVETHNHPTGISPHPGAATGAGGEIRDEAATGRGARPKAGLCGFTVSNLRIPGFEQPWETDLGKPANMASALTIMLDGPIGARRLQQRIRPSQSQRLFPHLRGAPAGRQPARLPQAGDDRRRLRQHPRRPCTESGGAGRGQAGGAGRSGHADRPGRRRGDVEHGHRQQLQPTWTSLSVAACQPGTGAALPGSGRRLLGPGRSQSDPVDSRCRGGWHLQCTAGTDSRRRPRRHHPPARHPLRRSLAVADGDLVQRGAGALRAGGQRRPARHHRKRSARASVAPTPWSAKRSPSSACWSTRPARPRRWTCRCRCCWASRPACKRITKRRAGALRSLRPSRYIELKEAAQRVLRLPAVAAKTFLISIGDRTVGGLTVRDQMVGPWQVPVADLRRHCHWLRSHHRRSHGHGRAPAAGPARRAGFRPHGGGRGDHQHRRRAHRQAGRCAPVRQLDGRRRPWRRGCAPVRHGARGGRASRARNSVWPFPVGKDSLFRCARCGSRTASRAPRPRR